MLSDKETAALLKDLAPQAKQDDHTTSAKRPVKTDPKKKDTPKEKDSKDSKMAEIQGLMSNADAAMLEKEVTSSNAGSMLSGADIKVAKAPNTGAKGNPHYAAEINKSGKWYYMIFWVRGSWAVVFGYGSMEESLELISSCLLLIYRFRGNK